MSAVHTPHSSPCIIIAAADETPTWHEPPLDVLEAEELCAVREKYRLARASVESLRRPRRPLPHFFRACGFVQHGVGPVDFVTGARLCPAAPSPPSPFFEVPACLERATCAFCRERLLRASDVRWDDKRQAWGCEARLLVPCHGSFAHPTCLPAKGTCA